MNFFGAVASISKRTTTPPSLWKALAISQATQGRAVTLWGRDQTTIDEINRHGRNNRYLSGIAFTKALNATTNAQEALNEAQVILTVIPAQSLRNALISLSPFIPNNIPIVLCAKGIEQSTGLLMSDVAAQCLPDNPIGALSGPSFALDVARGLPTAVVVATKSADTAMTLAQSLTTPNLRCYASDDLVGVEIGGALKNVLALAAGAARGAGLGSSAEAALITRGFAEMRRIASALGAQNETLTGLSGLGDLMLTCSSLQSRNLSYGIALATGENLSARPLAEGVASAHSAAKEAQRLGIDTPIISAVSEILNGTLTIENAVTSLLARPIKLEVNQASN
jgi:glycerol-3-phosphate dehydrogenase (NAD(P)+)